MEVVRELSRKRRDLVSEMEAIMERIRLGKKADEPASYSDRKALAARLKDLEVLAEEVKAQTAIAMEGGVPRKAKKTAKAKAGEYEKIARAKAEEAARMANTMADEAAKMAKAKAQEAEEAAEVAKAMAEQAAKAREASYELARLKEKETEWAQCEEELFATTFRRIWNKRFSRLGITFHETTSIPAMRYTYPDPDDHYCIESLEALQICSVKVTSIKDSLCWPLEVFGTIAVRDVVDHKRNIIFQRPRNNCQTIKEDDRYLALTGPSRAVAAAVDDPIYIEVSLKVKGTSKSKDKDLSELVLSYRTGCLPSCVYPSRLSTLEFEFDYMDCSVEATILIKVTGGSWPDGFQGVFTAVTTSNEDIKIKLLDFGDAGLPVDADGSVRLSRRVVSVDNEEELIVSVMAYPINKEGAVESSQAAFEHETAGISPPGELKVGSCSMEVAVAWSLIEDI